MSGIAIASRQRNLISWLAFETLENQSAGNSTDTDNSIYFAMPNSDIVPNKTLSFETLDSNKTSQMALICTTKTRRWRMVRGVILLIVNANISLTYFSYAHWLSHLF